MTSGNAQNTAFQQYTGTVEPSDSDVAAFPRLGGRTTLNRQPEAAWFAALEKRFNALTALPVGWDGYGGRPVSFTCARFAADLLQRLYDGEVPPPSLVPGADGSMQIEWHINQFDIEVDVLEAFHVVAIRHDCLTGETEEIELEADVTQLAVWISDLKVARTTAPEVGAA